MQASGQADDKSPRNLVLQFVTDELWHIERAKGNTQQTLLELPAKDPLLVESFPKSFTTTAV